MHPYTHTYTLPASERHTDICASPKGSASLRSYRSRSNSSEIQARSLKLNSPPNLNTYRVVIPTSTSSYSPHAPRAFSSTDGGLVPDGAPGACRLLFLLRVFVIFKAKSSAPSPPFCYFPLVHRCQGRFGCNGCLSGGGDGRGIVRDRGD